MLATDATEQQMQRNKCNRATNGCCKEMIISGAEQHGDTGLCAALTYRVLPGKTTQQNSQALSVSHSAQRMLPSAASQCDRYKVVLPQLSM